MSFTEMTGQPCVGKTTFISQEMRAGKVFQMYVQRYPMKFYCFFLGINYLGFKRARILFSWSLKESASFLFRINVFFNAVTKFGFPSKLSISLQESSPPYLVDEGLSHIPFLFLNTDTRRVVEFIAVDVRNANVLFLKSPGCDVIQDRLRKRGHKRLKFLSIPHFVQRNQEIENLLLSLYPNLCKKIEIY